MHHRSMRADTSDDATNKHTDHSGAAATPTSTEEDITGKPLEARTMCAGLVLPHTVTAHGQEQHTTGSSRSAPAFSHDLAVRAGALSTIQENRSTYGVPSILKISSCMSSIMGNAVAHIDQLKLIPMHGIQLMRGHGAQHHYCNLVRYNSDAAALRFCFSQWRSTKDTLMQLCNSVHVKAVITYIVFLLSQLQRGSYITHHADYAVHIGWALSGFGYTLCCYFVTTSSSCS